MTAPRLPVRNLLRIASDLEVSDPFLAYELEQDVLSLSGLRKVRKAVINPGVQTWEEHVENMVAVLKSLGQELTKVLNEVETLEELKDIDEAIKKFKVLFEDLDAEEQQLEEILGRSRQLGKFASSRDVAGVKDFLKGMWDKFKGEKAEADSSGMSPSYTMDEGTMDDIIEGKANWMDASQYIEEEFREHKDFFSGANDVLDQMRSVRDEAQEETLEKGAVQKLIEQVQNLIRHGQNMLKGIKKHLLEPAAQVVLEEDEEAPKKDEEANLGIRGLEGTVEHYIDVLRDNLDDEGKLLKLLKELFRKVKPLVEEERGSIAVRRQARRIVLPVLVRLAHARPHLRPTLLPVIRQATGR